MKTTADNDLISPEAVERLALAIRGACDCALGSSAEQPVGQTLRALAARLAEVEAQLKATLDREAAAYARHDARAERAEALVKAALERAAGIAAVCHRHVEYGPTFAPSQDIHHDTPAEIRDLDPAEIVKEWKESKNA